MASRDRSRNTPHASKKRWVGFAGLALVGIAVAIAVCRRDTTDGDQRVAKAPVSPPAPARVDFPINNGGGDARPPPFEQLPVEKQIESTMGIWRGGIVAKDAEAVVAADGAFMREPQKYLQALMTSAQTDQEDRVRAFSTKMLGKIKDPAAAPVFQKLLADKSQYVRMNAAWGLGELANTPDGRAAAKRALHALQRLAKTETVKDTRDAASLAARRLM